MGWTNVVPAKVQSAANNSTSCLGELESHLNGMVSAQDELFAAVKGDTGRAIYQTMSQAHSSGKSLAATLQEIVDALTDSGVKIDAHDVASAAEYKQFGADNVDSASAGMASDSVAKSVGGKADLNSWY